ncbi:hypothetical protein, partial [Teredinibacter turnerae]|uniref:hypothetical protein n=1 Tax=Teredinibacter turnerae TaxID=2426 RepID=UPI00059FF9B1
MKEKQFIKWENTRIKGKRNFILVNGIVSWGIPMFVVMTFFVNKPEEGHMSVVLICINALIWTLGGLAFGFFTWSASERMYKKELARRESA